MITLVKISVVHIWTQGSVRRGTHGKLATRPIAPTMDRKRVGANWQKIGTLDTTSHPIKCVEMDDCIHSLHKKSWMASRHFNWTAQSIRYGWLLYKPIVQTHFWKILQFRVFSVDLVTFLWLVCPHILIVSYKWFFIYSALTSPNVDEGYC